MSLVVPVEIAEWNYPHVLLSAIKRLVDCGDTGSVAESSKATKSRQG